MALRSRSTLILLVLGGLAVVVGIAGWIAFYVLLFRDLPDLHSLADYRPLLASRVLDRQGRLIGEFYDERRYMVSLEDLPAHVIQAFVASEDDAFFEHSGLDYRGILRAAWANLQAGGEIRQGGSTITQQVAKTLLLSPERRMTRKVKDMLLARRIEQRFSKQEILYLYLNQIYFGHGAYGVGEAARSYFGIAASELDVSQSALLAGLPQAPSAFSPYRNPDAAERRRRYVLRRMLEEGYLHEAAYEEVLASPPELHEPPEAQDFEVASWFVEEVRRHLFEVLGGERVRREGLVIETTLDLDMQHAGVDALRSGLERLDHRQGYRGAVRRILPEAIADALPSLAAENGFPVVEETPAEVPAELPLLAVVTEVDTENDVARVAFAPGLEGEVRLRDVRWARTPNPARYPVPVRSIERVFQVGDVTRFVRPEPDPDDAPTRIPRVLLHQEPAVEGALLAFEIETGDVLALVGGYDFARSEFNRVTQATRQPGSAFKPIIYAAALMEGQTPTSIVVDRPLVYEDPESGFVWRPGNYKGRFLGELTLREALSRSVNNATIHLLDGLDLDGVMAFTRAVGIESPLERNLSLALGASGVSLLELVRAYAVFPAGGRVVVPRFMNRVLDAEGQVLLERVPLGNIPASAAEAQVPDTNGDLELEPLEPPEPAPPVVAASEGLAENGEDEEEPLAPGHVLSERDAFLATDMLRGVVVDPEGTGKQARVLRRALGGKTGTTNEQGDAWFVGFSPDLAAGVWVGYDERRVLGKGETGGRAALPIWVDFMRSALADRPKNDFLVPEGIVFARVDRKTGLLAGAGSKDSYFQSYREGTAPTETAERSTTARESDRLLRLDAF